MPFRLCTYDDCDLPNPDATYATYAEAQTAAMLALCDCHTEAELPDCAAWQENCLTIDGNTELWVEAIA